MAITKAKIAVAFLLALLLSLSYSFSFKDLGTLFGNSKSLQCNAEPDPYTWILLAGISLMIGMMANAGMNALKGVLGGQKYDAFVKRGLWGAVETAALLGIFSAAFYGIPYGLNLHDYGVRNIDAARAYSSVIRNTVVFEFQVMMTGSTLLSFISRQAPTPRLPSLKAFPLSFQLAPMFRPIFDGMGILVQMLAGAIAAWVAHEFVLCFIKTYAFSTLLPIGIFLRAFGIRSAANALIGLSIALYFVYPFLMVQVGEMLNNYFMIGDDGQIQKPIICVGNGEPADENKVYIKNGPFAEDPNVPSSVRLQNRLDAEKVIESEIVIAIEKMLFPSVVFGGVYCVYNTGISDTFKIFLNILSSLGLWSLPAAASGLAALNLILKWTNLSWVATAVGALMISFVLHAMYDIVFFVFVVSIVLPILMIFMTITVAKEIAKALGTEIDLSAIEKII